MKICGIYKITSPSNKIYIGQSVNIMGRWGIYNGLHCKLQSKLYSSLKKYGANNHKFEILCQCSREELNNLEVYYIGLYNSFNTECGLNLKEGGGGKGKLSDEAKRNMSAGQKGKKMPEGFGAKIGLIIKGRKMSEKQKAQISARQKGRKRTPETIAKWRASYVPPVISEETREKLRVSSTGRKRSPESIAKTIFHNTGRKVSDETRKKMREKALGNTRGLGKKHSEESKKRMSASRLKYISENGLYKRKK